MREAEIPVPRILIVDDETKNIQVLGALLEQEGYDIYVAQNGNEALETAKEVLPDLMLLDVMMPPPDGFEVCRQVKASPKIRDLPIIFLTVKSDTEDILTGFEAGAADYVTKPFNTVELLARVRTHLNLKSAKDRLRERHRELAAKNAELILEMKERKRAEESLRESEECFRRLVKNGPDAILVLSPSGDILIANHEACRLLGYSMEEMLFVHMRDIVVQKPEAYGEPGTGFPIPREFWTEADFDRPQAVQTRFIRKEGEDFPAELHLIRIRLYRRDLTVVFAQDIQYRLEQEEERLHIRKLESLAVLSGGIAHDYNNLLFIISGNLSLIEADVADFPETADFVKEADRAVRRAAELTRELLIFSQTGEPIRKRAAVRDTISDLLSFHPPPDAVQLELNIADDIRAAEFDENQLLLVLSNILTNASEAMPGGGSIHMTVRNREIENEEIRPGIRIAPGPYIEIRVRDEGEGIPEQHMPLIYDPYFSTKQRGTRKGMGLGLAISYSVIRKHSGLLYAESQEGKGATFHILIPALPDASPETPPAELQSAEPIEKTDRIVRILVMDDEEMTLDAIKFMLTRMGYEVSTAIDGEEALNRYREALDEQKPFDAVILDLVIKTGMDGMETMKALKKLDPCVRAVVSSAYYDDPVMADFRKFGFTDVLPKPYHANKLREILGSIVSA